MAGKSKKEAVQETEIEQIGSETVEIGTIDKKTIEETIKEELKGVELPISVYDGDRLVRTYNKKDHGSDYKEKAIGFANKNSYQIK